MKKTDHVIVILAMLILLASLTNLVLRHWTDSLQWLIIASLALIIVADHKR